VLGFQTEDKPSNDLRATGLLGLRALCYFASRHTHQARALVAKPGAARSNRPVLPFAITAINVAMWCYELVADESRTLLPFMMRCGGEMNEQLFCSFHAAVMQQFVATWRSSKVVAKQGVAASQTHAHYKPPCVAPRSPPPPSARPPASPPARSPVAHTPHTMHHRRRHVTWD
jgi:hypothetical protein